jgi:hypothetical protein
MLGQFPDYLIHAYVNVVLEKASLPKYDLNNYRPIYNRSFISNILENVVAGRLRCHFNSKHSLYIIQKQTFIIQKLHSLKCTMTLHLTLIKAY